MELNGPHRSANLRLLSILWTGLFLFFNLLSGATFALSGGRDAGGGGGMDSGGGGSGLAFRLEAAKESALQALTAVKPEHLLDQPKQISEFYLAHRNELLVEAINAKIELLPASEVFIVFNGRTLLKPMKTGLTKGSTIYVQDTLATQDAGELTANLVHELGHHLGVPQDQDAFLDTLATAIVRKAITMNAVSQLKAQHCKSAEERMQEIAGTWRGTNSGFSVSNYPIEIKIDANGHWSGKSFCTESWACLRPLYYDDAKDHPENVLRIEGSCSGEKSEIDLVNASGSAMSLEISRFKLSSDGNSLVIRFKFAPAAFPVVLTLTRVKN